MASVADFSNENSSTDSFQGAYAGEVQRWQGFWLQGSMIGDMQTEIFQASDNRVYGYGCDLLGLFTWQGSTEERELILVKHYLGRHIVQYEGQRSEANNTIEGQWSLSGARDRFYFEILERPPVTGYLQEWRQQQEQRKTGRQQSTVDLVFTSEGRLYGGGIDRMGSYTVLGNHCRRGESVVAVGFLKQYKRVVASYEGVICEGEKVLVMQGTWTSDDGKSHSFMMTTIKA